MIFRYPGGKSKKKIREWIFGKFPVYFSEYREPFCGGANIFFYVNQSIKRWINDLDVNLMQVYFALRDRPEQFIALCRSIDPPRPDDVLVAAREGGKAIYNARLKKQFDFFVDNTECDQALRYFFTNRTNWAGRVVYELKSRMYFSVPEGWNIVKTDKLEKAAKILQGTKITCGDYSDLLEEHGENVLIYADPPYLVNSKLSKTSQLYKHNFSEQDHIIFAEKIKLCKHKVIISYDDCEFIRDLFVGFNFYTMDWTYCGTSAADGQSKEKRVGKELLITNY